MQRPRHQARRGMHYMDIVNKPKPTTTEDVQLLHEILGRLRAVEEGLTVLQLQVSSTQKKQSLFYDTRAAHKVLHGSSSSSK